MVLEGEIRRASVAWISCSLMRDSVRLNHSVSVFFSGSQLESDFLSLL